MTKLATLDLFQSQPRAEQQPSRCFLSGFDPVLPACRTPQSQLLDWLAEAHQRSGTIEPDTIRERFARFSAAAEQIATRGHEISDCSHRDWERMELYGQARPDLATRTAIFSRQLDRVFERLYPENSTPPGAIVHVTCTGYSAPSGAQKLVSRRGWGAATEVVHAYHMGCYAAHPGIRIARGWTSPNNAVDIVHTELCSLHLDPTRHEPADLVIQSLFADGFIRYQLSNARRKDRQELEILAARDEIIPDSSQAMGWSTGPFTFLMELSREVPSRLAAALPGFVDRLLGTSGAEHSGDSSEIFFAIHPGGPRIVELAQKVLGLEPSQTRHSRQVFRDHGNMSSATLPHIWQAMVEDPAVPDGTTIVSLGAGPGLTLSGMVFRKNPI